MSLKAGDVMTAQRTFTIEDVRGFTEVSGDRGRQHTEPDKDGRLMVHGLLTCTLFTEIGGQMNYIAREMKFEFVRPVFTGDTITARVEILSLEDQPRGKALVGRGVCVNQHGKEVLKSETNGVILTPRES